MATINNRYVVTLADGTTEEVQTTLEDRLAFETALRKNKSWGKLEDNSLKMQPYLAWHALRRLGRTDLSWVEFTTGSTAALDVSLPDENDTDAAELEVEGVGKDTPKAASTTSPSPSPENTAAPRGRGAAKPARA